MISRFRALGLCLVLGALSVLLIACGGSSKSSSANALANVSVTMSDPPTCGLSTGGTYAHVYVTVSDVQISTSASAGPNDSGWVDLTPNLKNAPQQIDLLGTPASGCFLAQLGTAGIPAGTYQQLRLILAPNTATPANTNLCRSAANCVVLASDLTNPRALQLSSEANTGIKIPSGQIAGGQFTVAAGETKDLNLDFDGCASIVAMANGGFRLKPVLHAGEVSTTASTAVVGRLLDATGNPIPMGQGIVALELKDNSGVDRVIYQATTDSNGNFVICPVMAGSYDLVAVAITATNNVVTAYGPTLVPGVGPGTTVGNVSLNLVSGNPSHAPAGLVGRPLVSSPTGVAVDFTVSALQQITLGSTPTWVTIPLAQQQNATASLSTAAGADCGTGAWCADGTLSVPASNITLGALNSGVITYTPAATGDVIYKVDAQAPAAANCATVVQTSNAITATAGADANVTPILAFTGCQ